MKKRLKKHIICSPKTLEELKIHIEYGKCNSIITKELFYDIITRIQNIEEELDITNASL
jgi:hypothetical protein